MKYFNRHRLSEHRPLSDINVTPLVDVVLVLLIIFMVTAPMLQMGIDVNLPKVKAKSVDITEEKLVLTIDGGRRIFLNKKQIPLPDLKPKLEAIFQDRIDREIQSVTGVRMTVELVKPQTLERSMGKAQRVVDHRRARKLI